MPIDGARAVTSALAAPVRRSLATALICDDRPAARRLMTHALTAGMAIDVVTAVSNALEASVAYTERPADVVLISLRRGGTVELDRFTELLRLHPGAAVIVFGDT